MNEITKVYQECSTYMEILDEGSLVKAISSKDEGVQDYYDMEDLSNNTGFI